MNLSEVKQLVSSIGSTPIYQLEITEPGFSLKVVRNSAPVAPVECAALVSVSGYRASSPIGLQQRPSQVLTANAVGEFLTCHPSRSSPLAPPGKEVSAGEVIGLLKIGYLYRPVYATHRGIILRVLAEAGQRVDYGRALFEVTLR